ncbi:hypothetical protein QTP88_027231 [Uroleucon formosanum]
MWERLADGVSMFIHSVIYLYFGETSFINSQNQAFVCFCYRILASSIVSVSDNFLIDKLGLVQSPEIILPTSKKYLEDIVGLIRQSSEFKNSLTGRGQDVDDFISKCSFCQMNKTSFRNTKQSMVISTTTFEPFERVFIGVVGALTRTYQGNVYILTLQCDLTKFSVATSMANKEANTVAYHFVTSFVCIHGMPHNLISNQGTEFLNRIFSETFNVIEFWYPCKQFDKSINTYLFEIEANLDNIWTTIEQDTSVEGRVRRSFGTSLTKLVKVLFSSKPFLDVNSILRGIKDLSLARQSTSDLVENQTSLFQTTMSENSKSISHISDHQQNLKENFQLLQTQANKNSMTINTLMVKTTLLEQSIILESLLNQYAYETQNFISIINSAIHGKIHSTVLPPIKLIKELRAIQLTLPAGTQLSVEPKIQNIPDFLSISSISILQKDFLLIFALHFPIIIVNSYDMYHPIPLPFYMKEDNAVIIEPAITTRLDELIRNQMTTNDTLLTLSYRILELEKTLKEKDGIIQNLEIKINILEQNERACLVEISGVKKEPNENVETIVNDIAGIIDVDINLFDIENVYQKLSNRNFSKLPKTPQIVEFSYSKKKRRIH